MLAFAVSQPRTDSWQPAAALGRLLAPIRATAPGLVLTSALLLALAIPFMLGLWLDPRVITGAPAWLKPLKFAISTGAYTLTLAWVFTYLSEWPRLRTWLEEDADGRRLHLHLMHAARAWQSAGRDPAELYKGARLASALEWSERHEPELDGLERAFVDESRAEAQLDAERQRRANRRLRVLLAGVGAFLALAVVLGVIAVSQRGQAREAAVAADAQRVGAEALGREQLDQALLLARAGVELQDSLATRGHLLSVLSRTPAVIGVLPPGGVSSYSSQRTRKVLALIK